MLCSYRTLIKVKTPQEKWPQSTYKMLKMLEVRKNLIFKNEKASIFAKTMLEAKLQFLCKFLVY